MPAISVIVPLYNTRNFIGECLESLKAQTFGDFQVICVDDASTDGSLACARAAAAGDDRFVFVERSRNGGLSAARNTGLAHATGSYVSFLDSDDRYAPEALERLHRAAVGNDADLVDFSASTFYDSDAARKRHSEDYGYRSDIPGVMTGTQLFTRYMERGQFVPSACFHLVKRSLLDGGGTANAENGSLRFVDGLLHEDEMFTPQLYVRARRALFLNEQLYERRLREGSIMTTPRTARNVDAVFRITQMHHAWLIQNARSYDAAFVDAYARNVAFLCDIAFGYFHELPAQEARAYLDSLSAQDRVDFDLSCRYASQFAQDRCDEVSTSRAYRLAQRLRALQGRLPLPSRRQAR